MFEWLFLVDVFVPRLGAGFGIVVVVIFKLLVDLHALLSRQAGPFAHAVLRVAQLFGVHIFELIDTGEPLLALCRRQLLPRGLQGFEHGLLNAADLAPGLGLCDTAQAAVGYQCGERGFNECAVF